MESISPEAQNLELALRSIIEGLGEDPDREGLRETPKRWVKFMREFLDGGEQFNLTTFDAEGYDEPIFVGGIPFYSMCEHHLAPFFGHATVAYWPKHRIVGISKLPRTVKLFSSRLQNQERMTQQIGEYLEERLDPRGVAVMATARHMCMEMRGVKCHEASTLTTWRSGILKSYEWHERLLNYHQKN